MKNRESTLSPECSPLKQIYLKKSRRLRKIKNRTRGDSNSGSTAFWPSANSLHLMIEITQELIIGLGGCRPICTSAASVRYSHQTRLRVRAEQERDLFFIITGFNNTTKKSAESLNTNWYLMVA